MIDSDLLNKMKEKQRSIRKVFNTADGQVLLEVLEDEFDKDILFDPDPLKMAYKLGGRDLLTYIKQIISHKEGDV
jgi:hypothetical protein